MGKTIWGLFYIRVKMLRWVMRRSSGCAKQPAPTSGLFCVYAFGAFCTSRYAAAERAAGIRIHRAAERVRVGRVVRGEHEGLGLRRVRDQRGDARAQRGGSMGLSPYDSVEAVAARLQKTNRRLPRDKALDRKSVV